MVDQTRGGKIDLYKRWVYLSGDYFGGELCTLAQACINLGIKQRTMADAINAGQDLHTRLASRFIGIKYEEGMARRKAKDSEIIRLRQSAKPINFGKPGLMGPPKMVFTARKDGVYFCEGAGRSEKGECFKNPRATTYGKGRSARKIPPTCEVCLELAKLYSDLWYEEFPEMVDYHEITVAVAKEAEDGIPLESFGTGMLRLETNPNAVSNHFFQNLLAQAAKHALCLIQKEAYTDRRSVLFNNCRIGVFVHDENLAEVREAVMDECGWRVCKMMVDGAQPFCPDVKFTVDPALQRRWFKGAELAKDKAGKLKPWWPVDPKCSKWPAHASEDCKCWKWAPDQTQMGMDLAA